MVCSESIASYIDQHFVMWAYDLTETRLQQQVLTECQAIFGLSGRKQVGFNLWINKCGFSFAIFEIIEKQVVSDANFSC